jgi:hypothetical protein
VPSRYHVVSSMLPFPNSADCRERVAHHTGATNQLICSPGATAWFPCSCVIPWLKCCFRVRTINAQRLTFNAQRSMLRLWQLASARKSVPATNRPPMNNRRFSRHKPRPWTASRQRICGYSGWSWSVGRDGQLLCLNPESSAFYRWICNCRNPWFEPVMGCADRTVIST